MYQGNGESKGGRTSYDAQDRETLYDSWDKDEGLLCVTSTDEERRERSFKG